MPERGTSASAVETLLRSAQKAVLAGNLPAAVRDLEGAVRVAPRDPRPHQRLAAVFRRANYLDREIEELEIALKLAPSDADSAFRLGEIYISLVWFDKGRERVVQGELARPNDRRLFALLATQAYMRFQYPQMELAATEGLKRFPKDIVLMTLLSEANRLQGHLPEAERLLRRVQAIATEPRAQTACRVGLARLFTEDRWPKPRYADAEHAARAALKVTPTDTDARYWLARALQLAGRWKEACPLYETVLRRDPEFEKVRFFLGNLYIRSGDAAKQAAGKRLLDAYRKQQAQEEQYRDVRDAVWQHPGSLDAHRNMGREYQRAGQLPQAIVEFRYALRLRPGDAQTRRLLAQALRQAHRLTEAQKI